MSTFDNLIDLDGNGRPIYGDSPFRVKKTVTFSGDDETVATPLFTVVGEVMVTRIWGVVTTALGASHTDAHWRVNDQTATDQIITKATTLDLGSISEGAVIFKSGLITAVATYKTADAGSFYEPTTLQTGIFTPFLVVQKTGDIQTDIEYVYTTAGAETTGAMTFYVSYYPLSPTSYIAAA